MGCLLAVYCPFFNFIWCAWPYFGLVWGLFAPDGVVNLNVYGCKSGQGGAREPSTIYFSSNRRRTFSRPKIGGALYGAVGKPLKRAFRTCMGHGGLCASKSDLVGNGDQSRDFGPFSGFSPKISPNLGQIFRVSS